MAEQTTTSPRLSPDDLVQFVETHRPRLKAGDYSIKVTQSIEDVNANSDLHFAVAGERYTVKETEIHGMFPAPAAHGSYHRVLPHILLTRSTLPWERSPRGDGTEQFLSPSWLALLLFSAEEQPAVTTVKVGSSDSAAETTTLKHEVDVRTAVKLGTGAWRPLPREVTEHPQESVNVIDVPWKLLKQQIPTYEDLSLLSHVRRIEPARKPTDDQDEVPEIAVVFGNRLPPTGTHCTAHLVSLEDRYTSPEEVVKRATYELAWEDDHEAFELNGPHAADLKALLEACEAKLNALRHEVLEEMESADAKQKHALRRLLERSAVRLELNAGQPPAFLAPLSQSQQPSSQPLTAAQIKTLLGASEADFLKQPETVEVQSPLRDIGPVRATVRTHQGVAEGRTVEHLAANVSLPPAMPVVNHTGVKGDLANVVKWLTEAHRKNATTVTLESGQAPKYVDEQGTNVDIPGAKKVAQNQVQAYGSAPKPRKPTPDAAGRRVHMFGFHVDQTTQLLVRVKLETSPVVKVTWTLAECTTLADELHQVLKAAQQAGAREVVLEEGLRPMLLGPFSPELSDTLSAKFPLAASTLCELAKASLPPHWRQRTEMTREVELSGALRLEEGRHIDLDLALRAEQPGKEKQPRPAQATFIVRPARHLYFDHLGAEQQPEAKLRLVSLKRWQFTCDPAGADFHDLIVNLQGIHGDTRDEAQLRLPTEGHEHSAAGPYLQAGHVPLTHHLRQGSKTVSWYRGPLIPQLRPGGDHTTLPLPARCADELLIFDRSVGMFDASYATAWELGRMMALADKRFSTALYQWKRARRRELTHLRQEVDRTFLPVAQPLAADVHLPEDLASWLAGLTKLEGVPFNYLLPDERILPPESIRFFVVDPLWLECLRDGAMSIGRVLRTDHGFDHDTWTQQPRPPRISGFLMRSAAVLSFPKMAVQAYVAPASDEKWQTESHLDPEAYQPLTELRRINLDTDLMLCLVYDAADLQRELNLLELHLPPEILHFGVEEGAGGGFTKQLRDPRTGDQLTVAIAGRDVDPAQVEKFEISGGSLLKIAETGVQPRRLAAFVHGVVGKETDSSLEPWGVELPANATQTAADQSFEKAVKTCLKEDYSDTIYRKIRKYAKSTVVDDQDRQGQKKQVHIEPAALKKLARELPELVSLRLLARMLRGPITFAADDTEQQGGPHNPRQLLESALHKHAPELDAETLWKIGKKQIDESIRLDAPYWRAHTKSTWAWIKGDVGELLANKPAFQENPQLLASLAKIARQSVHGTGESDARLKLQAKVRAALGLDYTDDIFHTLCEQAVTIQPGQGGILNVGRLFATTADRLRPAVGTRAVTAGDFGLQMLDAAPLVRVLRQEPPGTRREK